MNIISVTGPKLHSTSRNFGGLMDSVVAYWEGYDTKSTIIQLDFQGARTKKDLFSVFSKGLDFPSYFGENWSALRDCLSDLAWIDSEAFTILIANSDAILADEESAQFDIFVRILLDTVEEWSHPIAENDRWDRPAVPFHILFHVNRQAQHAWSERIKEYSLAFGRI